MTNTPFRLAWATDTHFDHIIQEPIFFKAFVNSVKNGEADGLLLTGDISNGTFLVDHLRALHKGLGQGFPIWFVCGNHDYYHSSIEVVRNEITQLALEIPEIQWLGNKEFVSLNASTALVGHDGWYDALYSDIGQSRLMMNDFIVIRELAPLHQLNIRYVVHQPNEKLHRKLQELSRESAKYVEQAALLAIAQGHTTIVIGTHIPPFPQNSLYKGKQSDQHWLPFFSSKHMGETLLNLADAHPEVQFRVFCGHSHGKALFAAGRTNLLCETGEAQYGAPRVNSFLEF